MSTFKVDRIEPLTSGSTIEAIGLVVSGTLQTSTFNNFTSSYTTGSFTGSFDGIHIGDGSQLTGLNFVTTSSFNNFTSSYTTGSFTGSFDGIHIGDGSQLTGLNFVDLTTNQTVGGEKYFTSNVGIGTSSPASKLHVRGGFPTLILQRETTGDSNSRIQFLADDNSSSFDLVGLNDSNRFEIRKNGSTKLFVVEGEGDVGIGTDIPSEKLTVYGNSSPSIELKNGPNYSVGGFVINRTNYGQKWKWWAQSQSMYFAYATSGGYSNKVTLNGSTGNLGVGTTSPSEKLEVNGNIRVDVGSNGTGGLFIYGSNQSTGRVYVGQDGSYGGGIEYNGDGSPATTGAGSDYVTLWRRDAGNDEWTARNRYLNNNWEFRGDVIAYASDERLKENIKVLTDPIKKIKTLKGVEYDWIEECEELGFIPNKKHETGVLAQDVKKAIPDAIYPAPFDKDYLTVDKQKIIPLLIEGIKEQQTTIDKLENENKEQQQQINNLNKRLEKLEKLLF